MISLTLSEQSDTQLRDGYILSRSLTCTLMSATPPPPLATPPSTGEEGVRMMEGMSCRLELMYWLMSVFQAGST